MQLLFRNINLTRNSQIQWNQLKIRMYILFDWKLQLADHGERRAFNDQAINWTFLLEIFGYQKEVRGKTAHKIN